MNKRSFLLTQEPRWISGSHGFALNMPAAVKSWTYETGSLTQRLRSYLGSALTVKVLHQGWYKPFLTEARLLDKQVNPYCLVREVMLHANGNPLILARTIIPAETLKATHRNLSHLGNRPLGEVIFSYPELARLALQVSSVDLTLWTHDVRSCVDITTPTPARRTVYVIAGKPMLVSEFFLPVVLHQDGKS